MSRFKAFYKNKRFSNQNIDSLFPIFKDFFQSGLKIPSRTTLHNKRTSANWYFSLKYVVTTIDVLFRKECLLSELSPQNSFSKKKLSLRKTSLTNRLAMDTVPYQYGRQQDDMAGKVVKTSFLHCFPRKSLFLMQNEKES